MRRMVYPAAAPETVGTVDGTSQENSPYCVSPPVSARSASVCNELYVTVPDTDGNATSVTALGATVTETSCSTGR